MNELDEIMSGDSNVVPEIQQEQPTTQPRDEGGRFAAKQEAPAVVEQPVAEAQPAPHQEMTEEHPANGGIPQARLKAEAEKRREAEADAAALRREIAELRGMVQARQQPAQPQQEKQPVSIFEDPEAFLSSQLSPVQQTIQEMREELWESRAAAVHTSEAVEAAKAAADALDPASKAALHRHITTTGNPFDNLVKWHKQQQTLARVGNDPDAWLNAEKEKLLNDPEFLAQAMERARAGASANVNRSQPNTNLPRSISRLPAGGNMPADNDMSDGALFSNALR